MNPLGSQRWPWILSTEITTRKTQMYEMEGRRYYFWKPPQIYVQLNIYFLSRFFLMLHYICLFTLLVHLVQWQNISAPELSDTRKQDTVTALMETITSLRKIGHQMCDFGTTMYVGMMGAFLPLCVHIGEYLVT